MKNCKSLRPNSCLRLMGGALLPLLMSGCAGIGQHWRETSGIDTTGAFQITNRNVVEPVDLGYLLLRYAPSPEAAADNCEALASRTPNWARGGVAADEGLQGDEFDSKDRTRLDRSVRYFACRSERATEDQRRLARNTLQERLLLSSEQRCSAFKIGLQREFSRTNFGLGVLSTLAGTAGALVNSVSAARNWAGTAAVSSGVRAEFNQDFFANLAAHVVIDGVDKRRREVYEQIQRYGQAKAYADYPVEAAIKDALYYHGQCSVAAGFQMASDAIKLYDDPGINTGLAMIAKIRAANLMLNDTSLGAEDLLKKAGTVVESGPKLAGSRLVASSRSQERKPLDELSANFATIRLAVDDMRSAVDQYKSRRKPEAPSEAELGLSAADFSAAGLEPGIEKSCRTQATNWYAAARASEAQAGAQDDVKKRSEFLADAAKSDKQLSILVEQAQTLSRDFKVRVADALTAWSLQFAQANKSSSAESKKAAAALQALLGKAPKLQDAKAELTALKTLCGSAQ